MFDVEGAKHRSVAFARAAKATAVTEARFQCGAGRNHLEKRSAFKEEIMPGLTTARGNVDDLAA